MSRAGLQARQPLDRLRRAPLGPRLQEAPHQDQHHDHRRRLEVHIHRACRQHRRQEGSHRGKAPRGQRAHCHQRIHVGCPAQQRRNAFAVEAQPRHEQHQRRQHELQVPAVLRADGMRHPVMEGRHHVPAHLQQEHRQRQRCRQPQVTPQRPLLGYLAIRNRVSARFPGNTCTMGISGLAYSARSCTGILATIHHACRIPGLLGRRQQRRHRRQSTHRRPFRGQVHAGRTHARHRLQRPLHPAHARGATHLVHLQHHGALGHVIAHLLHRLHQLLRLQRLGQRHRGPLGGQVHVHRRHPGHLAQRHLHPPHTRRAAHALDGQHESLGCLLQPGAGHNRIRFIHDPFPCRFTALLEPPSINLPIVGRSMPLQSITIHPVALWPLARRIRPFPGFSCRMASPVQPDDNPADPYGPIQRPTLRICPAFPPASIHSIQGDGP